MYHIHVDAHYLLKEFEEFLLNHLNFWNTDFSGYPQGVLHYETPRHLTWKTQNSRDFKLVFNTLLVYVKQHPTCFKGYIEGEFIPLDINIKERPFNPEVAIPFEFELKSLPPNIFREDEIHITFNRDKSDFRLINALRSMGFFSAYMEKPSGAVEILTVQGTYQQIQFILPQILTYLNQVGGAIECSVKEERIVRWWRSSPEITLPPVIKSICIR